MKDQRTRRRTRARSTQRKTARRKTARRQRHRTHRTHRTRARVRSKSRRSSRVQRRSRRKLKGGAGASGRLLVEKKTRTTDTPICDELWTSGGSLVTTNYRYIEVSDFNNDNFKLTGYDSESGGNKKFEMTVQHFKRIPNKYFDVDELIFYGLQNISNGSDENPPKLRIISVHGISSEVSDREVNIRGCTIRNPKTKRPGHPTAFRVDLAQTDNLGSKKYIIDGVERKVFENGVGNVQDLPVSVQIDGKGVFIQMKMTLAGSSLTLRYDNIEHVCQILSRESQSIGAGWSDFEPMFEITANEGSYSVFVNASKNGVGNVQDRPVLVQIDGKGDFVLMNMTLAGSELTLNGEGISERKVDIGGCRIGIPKSKRPGHPNAFRVDLAQPDNLESTKYIIEDVNPYTLKFSTYGISLLNLSGNGLITDSLKWDDFSYMYGINQDNPFCNETGVQQCTKHLKWIKTEFEDWMVPEGMARRVSGLGRKAFKEVVDIGTANIPEVREMRGREIHRDLEVLGMIPECREKLIEWLQNMFRYETAPASSPGASGETPVVEGLSREGIASQSTSQAVAELEESRGFKASNINDDESPISQPAKHMGFRQKTSSLAGDVGSAVGNLGSAVGRVGSAVKGKMGQVTDSAKRSKQEVKDAYERRQQSISDYKAVVSSGIYTYDPKGKIKRKPPTEKQLQNQYQQLEKEKINEMLETIKNKTAPTYDEFEAQEASIREDLISRARENETYLQQQAE